MSSMAPRLSSFHEVSSRIPRSKVMELAQASFERPPDSWTVGEPRFLSKGLLFRDVTFWTNGEATRRLSMKQDFHFRQEVKCKVLGLPGSQFPEAKIGQSWKMSRISSNQQLICSRLCVVGESRLSFRKVQETCGSPYCTHLICPVF